MNDTREIFVAGVCAGVLLGILLGGCVRELGEARREARGAPPPSLCSCSCPCAEVEPPKGEEPRDE